MGCRNLHRLLIGRWCFEAIVFFCMQFIGYSKPPVRSPEPHAVACQSKYADETTIICCFEILNFLFGPFKYLLDATQFVSRGRR